ncbi:MAG: hypothetical protein EA340_09985 [Nitriliruptor sp.]|nr:MAG: hypothetical protein EA340_09985 [Nitriliruptor sp.]
MACGPAQVTAPLDCGPGTGPDVPGPATPMGRQVVAMNTRGSETQPSSLALGSDPATVRDDPPAFRAELDVRDFALVTYLVPAERLASLLLPGLELQTVDRHETSWAFVSASCFLNHELRWAAGPSPTWTFYQSTYRTYVRRGEDVGTLFLASYVETLPATLGQKLGLANTQRARFAVDIDRDPSGGYRSYRAVIDAGDDRAHLEVSATEAPHAPEPFGSPDDHVRFLTHRLHGYAHAATGLPIDAQVEHDEMVAYGGRLLRAYFPPLDAMGLLDPTEQRRPYSVLVAPGVRFQLLAPIPMAAP